MGAASHIPLKNNTKRDMPDVYENNFGVKNDGKYEGKIQGSESQVM